LEFVSSLDSGDRLCRSLFCGEIGSFDDDSFARSLDGADLGAVGCDARRLSLFRLLLRLSFERWVWGDGNGHGMDVSFRASGYNIVSQVPVDMARRLFATSDTPYHLGMFFVTRRSDHRVRIYPLLVFLISSDTVSIRTIRFNSSGKHQI